MEENEVQTSEEDLSIWNKKQTDLTVGDAVKMNTAALAIMAGVSVAIVAVPAGIEKISSAIQRRRLLKEMNAELDDDEPKWQ